MRGCNGKVIIHGDTRLSRSPHPFNVDGHSIRFIGAVGKHKLRS
jgi:hypothetical protein